MRNKNKSIFNLDNRVSKSIDRVKDEAIMEALNEIYHAGNKDETYLNLVQKITQLGKKLYRNER